MSIVFNKHNPKSFVVRGELIENLKSRQKLISQLSGKCVYNTRLKFGSGLLVPINETNEKILQNFTKLSNENSVTSSPTESCEIVNNRPIINESNSVYRTTSKDKETNRLQSVMIPYQETIDNDVSEKNTKMNNFVLEQVINRDSDSPRNIDDLLLKLINDSNDEQIDVTTQSSHTRQTDTLKYNDNDKQVELKMHTFDIVHNNNLKETENMKNKNQKKQHKEKKVSIIDKTNLPKMSNVNREKNLDGRSKKGNNRDDKKSKNTNMNLEKDENDRNNTTTEDSRQKYDLKKTEREESHNSRLSSRNAERYEKEKREREKRERDRNERERRHKKRSRNDSSSENSSETSDSSDVDSDSSESSEYSGDSSEDERIQKTIRRKGQRPDRRQVELNDSDVDSDHEDIVTLSRRVRYIIRKIHSIEDYLRK